MITSHAFNAVVKEDQIGRAALLRAAAEGPSKHRLPHEQEHR